MIFSTVGLGVTDPARALTFYTQGLGFEVQCRPLEGLVYLATGPTRLALYPVDQLARYAGAALQPGSGVVLGLNLDTHELVDLVFARACAQGGTGLRPPAVMDWGGYAGTVADPDAHVWEIACSGQSVAKS